MMPVLVIWRWRVVIFLMLFTVVWGGLTPAIFAQDGPPVIAGESGQWIDRAGGEEWGVEVVLAATALAPGEFRLDLTATPLLAAPDLILHWSLPDGGVLVDGGADESLGRVLAGQTVTRSRRVHFAVPGTYAIHASASYQPDPSTHLTAVGVLFLTWEADGRAAVLDVDPRLPVYAPLPLRSTVDKSDRQGEVAASAAAGCFNVKGILTRNERLPSVSGGAGVYEIQRGSARTVHHVVVELREEDTISDDSYGFTVTDGLGNFAFNFCDDDGVLDNELELYFRVCAEVRDNNELVARVTDSRNNLYCFDSRRIESSGGLVDFDVTVYDDLSIEAAVFNIADALYYARRFWNDNSSASPRFDRAVTVRWERGSGEDGSFYSDERTTIVIADDASSPDEWDDSVIIHEWGHFADHQYSCYRNPGGRHSLPGINNGVNGTRLSWGEGYPNYYQSAVRSIMPGTAFASYYIDPSGPTVDLERRPGQASDRNEGAIAALLLDFFDGDPADNQDTVRHGQALIQYVYTHPAFQGNAQCDLQRFLRVWRDLGLATDAATAAAVVQNVNVDINTRWWGQVALVVDTSSSMAAGGGQGKLGAVKQLIAEQVNDFTAAPKGTDVNLYTFAGGGAGIQPVLEGRFFSQQIMPAVNALTANGADSGCNVTGLDALTEAIQNKYNAAAWLYTDGESASKFDSALMQRQLGERRIRASTVLLGGCGAPARSPLSTTGAEKSYLSLSADASQSSGMVSYLLTALMSGGQFLYVAPDQLANAANILRAQLDHTAGAGRWSDYVSDLETYRADRLLARDYMVIDTTAGGTYHGMTENGPVKIFYSLFSWYEVYSTGRIVHYWSSGIGGPSWTTTYHILDGNIPWYSNFGNNEFPDWRECAGSCTQVFSRTVGDWFVIASAGNSAPPPSNNQAAPIRYYQLLVNTKTGEVRYQYGPMLSNDSRQALIGIDNHIAPPLIVSEYSVNGARNGGGYQFVPAPPQPTKTYAVDVDPLIESVIFLQTGYSGSFAPMIVRDPDGVPVNCGDGVNVRCISLNGGLVQFVQVNTNGRGGVYEAVIDAGATGWGTFSFNALAAGEIQVESLIPHVLSLKPIPLRVDLGRAFDGNSVQAWFQKPNGAPIGQPFTLYDDGAHGDDNAGDGLFALESLTPTAGVAYLWIEGVVDGVTIRRSDPIPFNFQPLDVTTASPELEAYYGDATTIPFTVTNQSDDDLCYAVTATAPAEWTVTLSDSFPCVAAQSVQIYNVTVQRQAAADALGERGQLLVTFTEEDAGQIVAAAAVDIAFFRPVVAAAFDNRAATLRPNSTDSTTLDILLLDDLGNVSERSGEVLVELSTTLGSIAAGATAFVDGRLPVIFTAGDQSGVADITAILGGELTVTTTVTIDAAQPTALQLTAAPADLRTQETSLLTVTARDDWGDPVAGVSVRLSVGDDDGSQGAFDGAESVDLVTAADGTAGSVFTKGAAPLGSVIVRAELLSAGSPKLEATAVLTLSEEVALPNQLYLPMLVRDEVVTSQ